MYTSVGEAVTKNADVREGSDTLATTTSVPLPSPTSAFYFLIKFTGSLFLSLFENSTGLPMCTLKGLLAAASSAEVQLNLQSVLDK